MGAMVQSCVKTRERSSGSPSTRAATTRRSVLPCNSCKAWATLDPSATSTAGPWSSFTLIMSASKKSIWSASEALSRMPLAFE